MKKITSSASLLYGIIIFSFLLIPSCAVTTINSSYDSARSLEKGGLKGAIGLTQINSSSFDQNDHSDNFHPPFYSSLHVTYGITDIYDVRINYFRHSRSLFSPKFHSSSDFKLSNLGVPFSFIQLDNKLTVYKNYFALSLPIGSYAYNDIKLKTLSPRVYFTITDKREKVEFTVSPWIEIFLNQNMPEEFNQAMFLFKPRYGIQSNIGFGKSVDKWMIRFEYGIGTTNSVDFPYQASLGASFYYKII